MRGSLGVGLVIGILVGGGAMYLALRQPWAGHTTAPADAGVVAVVASDAGVKKSLHKHGSRRHPPGTGGGNLAGGGNADDQAWANQPGNDEEAEAAVIQLTAADRVLEWRGDDVSPSPTKIDMNGNNNARALDDGEIQSTISSQSAAVQSCVVQAATNADLRATITIKMVVEGTGHVSRSKLQAPHYLFEHGLLACVKGALARVHFPATGMPTLVTMPVNLT